MRHGFEHLRCVFPLPQRVIFTGPLSCRIAWALRPGFLRRRTRRKRVLFAGPWVGEFGWELMNWQGYVRRVSRDYEHVVVCCRPDRRALYRDFCGDFVDHYIKGTPNCHTIHNMENRGEWARVLKAVPGEADHMRPIRYIPASEQEFVRFGSVDETRRTDIILHARGRSLDTKRNWGVEQWHALIETFRGQGLRLGCIGLPGETLDVEGVRDFRGGTLSETMDVLRSTRLVIGPSSGPMHLASLCGAPHLVWTDRRTFSMHKTSRQKYESWWNPLRTHAVVIDNEGFKPSLETVVAETTRALMERSATPVTLLPEEHS